MRGELTEAGIDAGWLDVVAGRRGPTPEPAIDWAAGSGSWAQSDDLAPALDASIASPGSAGARSSAERCGVLIDEPTEAGISGGGTELEIVLPQPVLVAAIAREIVHARAARRGRTGDVHARFDLAEDG